MESVIFTQFKNMINRMTCCQVTMAHTLEPNIPMIHDESNLEIRTSTAYSVTEDVFIQKVPKTSRKLYQTDEVFKIKNLDSGQEIDIRNENKSDFLTEFSSVTDTPNKDLAEYYKKKQKMNERLWDAVSENQGEICKLLLNPKNYGSLIAQVNSRGENDESALHIAARLGYLNICQILMDCGEKIDVNAKDRNGSTPLHLSCKCGNYLVAQFLIRSGAFLNALDNFKNSPLHYAVDSGNLKLIKYLFNRFPGLSEKNIENLTPLELLQEKNIEIATECKVEPLEIPETEYTLHERLSSSSFEAIQVLGRGSFGEVYLVKMITTGKLYAMKVLRKEKIIEQNLVKYAMVERNILSTIRHPFIIKLNYAFQSEDKLFLVLDYCSGGNLTYYIGKEKHFTEDMAKVYLCEIILALEELHKNGIIYRDLKPDNIIIDGQGHALLTDFGLSKQGMQDNSCTNSFCGSLAYLAPEMIKRTGHGKAVDWYLLGVLFYEMLIGFPPFSSMNREQVLKNIENAKLRIPVRVSATARDLIKKLMKRNLNKRLGSKNGAEEVKSHPFFADVDWEVVLKKELVPPVIPRNLITPAFVPKYHMAESAPEDEKMKHLDDWTFIAD